MTINHQALRMVRSVGNPWASGRGRCWLLFAAGLLALAALGGCGSSDERFADPVGVMMDQSASYEKRWKAARQAEREQATAEKRVLALQRLVWVRGYPMEFSNYAVDELVKINEADARAFLIRIMPLIKDWDTLRYVFDMAVARDWKDLTPAIVQNYAIPTQAFPDADRPERKALEALHPGVPAARTIMNVISLETTGGTERQRIAAWQLLNRLSDKPGEVATWLKGLPATDGLITDLQAGAAELGVVPVQFDAIVWLRELRKPERISLWNQSKAALGGLDESQKKDIEVRHLPVAAWAHQHRADWMKLSRAQLLGLIEGRLDSAPHFTRGPVHDGGAEDHPQMLRDWKDQLSWGDLLMIRTVMEVMEDSTFTEQWFNQADADLKDTTTEYGGLLVAEGQGKLRPQLYKPTNRQHDLKFNPPYQMLKDHQTSLGHYHFHAHEVKNRTYAGPGRGDLQLAKLLQCNGIVLTFIDEKTLNVDFYRQGGVVVDLGVIRR